MQKICFSLLSKRYRMLLTHTWGRNEEATHSSLASFHGTYPTWACGCCNKRAHAAVCMALFPINLLGSRSNAGAVDGNMLYLHTTHRQEFSIAAALPLIRRLPLAARNRLNLPGKPARRADDAIIHVVRSPRRAAET